jgi:preprotein translocase subunit SecB
MNPFSPMQLRDYLLGKLFVEANPSFNSQEGVEIEQEYGVDFDFKKQEGKPVFRIDLSVSLNCSEKAFRQSPYRIQIHLISFIEFDERYPEHDIPKLLVPNGLAMTYSIARGIVGQATGTSLHGKYILPTVNFVELVKAKFRASAEKKKNTGRKKKVAG